MGAIDGAISAIAKTRGDLGAIANRLDHSADSVLAETTAIKDARSLLVDADYCAGRICRPCKGAGASASGYGYAGSS